MQQIPTFLLVIIIAIIAVIVILIVFIAKLSNKDENKKADRQKRIIKKDKKEESVIKTHDGNIQNNKKDKKSFRKSPPQIELETEEDISTKARPWQTSMLVKIAKERLNTLSNNQKLNESELEVLSKIIEKKDSIDDLGNLVYITKNEDAYGVINIALLDHIYFNITKKENKDEIIKTVYLIDMINGGISTPSIPENLDITATLINLLNKNIDSQTRIPSESVKRGCLELAANGGWKNLDWATCQVTCRVILESISDSVYNMDNLSKLLSDENKIYIRLLCMVITNKNYDDIVEFLSSM